MSRLCDGRWSSIRSPHLAPSCRSASQRALRRQPAWPAEDCRTRMCPSAAEVKAIDGHRVPTPTSHRTHEQDLIESDLALCHRALREPELLLEIERCHHLTSDRVAGQLRYHATDD